MIFFMYSFMHLINSSNANNLHNLIVFFATKDGEALYSQQKQDQELTVAQISSVQFSCSVVSDSLRPHELQHRQASLSITNFRSPPKPMSIVSVMPSNHLILSSPSPPALSLSGASSTCSNTLGADWTWNTHSCEGTWEEPPPVQSAPTPQGKQAPSSR